MYTFIINAASPRAVAIWPLLERQLIARGVAHRAWHTHAPGQATQLARLACARGEGARIVVVGGDGTANAVLAGIDDFAHTALGIIPAGSGNDLARGLGLPRYPTAALARILQADGSRRVDLGLLQLAGQDPRPFAISAGVGLDAWICEQVNASRCKAGLARLGLSGLSYGLMTVAAAWQTTRARGSVTLETPRGRACISLEGLVFLACMNFPWEGGGVPVAPGASATDGCFSVCIADGLSRHQTYARLPRLATGRHIHTAGVRLIPASAVHLSLDQPLPIHADGEVPGRAQQLSLRVLPRALRVLA